MQKTDQYFSFLAKHFPVMCASDEFHFMPRAEAAAEYYDRLEDLDRDALEEHLRALHRFKEELESGVDSIGDFESFIDIKLVLSNIAGILIELEDRAILKHNPLVYLKVAFIGLDHAVSRPAENISIVHERALERLRHIPCLFAQAQRNLESVPALLHTAASYMIGDCFLYLDEIQQELSLDADTVYGKMLVRLCSKVRSALARFKNFLDSFSERTVKNSDDDIRAADTIEATLKKHFLSTRSLEEIYRIGMEERARCLAELHYLQAAIDPDKTWQELYDAYLPVKSDDIMSLYRSECSRLGEFFAGRGFEIPAEPSILQTPLYLRSVRGSASFSASLPTDGPGSDHFYITMENRQLQKGGFSHEDGQQRGSRFLNETCTVQKDSRPYRATSSLENMQQRVNRRLHRELKYLTAHEAIPGHHLLDYRRKRLLNPVRRQIESPLFYEGWACYAESLLIEYGYIDSPIELLVNQKRNLWRAARCQIDAGLAAGILDINMCIGLLEEAGFEEDEARTQIGRFLLNPGYQLCYTLGRYEILQLRRRYGTVLGLTSFHREMLDAGELPFILLEKRLAELSKQRNI